MEWGPPSLRPKLGTTSGVKETIHEPGTCQIPTPSCFLSPGRRGHFPFLDSPLVTSVGLLPPVGSHFWAPLP